MNSYKFYLQDPKEAIPIYTEVVEPMGWDAVEFNTVRSQAYFGLENEYSENLIFDKDGGEYLKGIFEEYNFDSLIDFKVEEYCNGVLESTVVYAINMVTYRNVEGEVSVRVEDSSFSRKFKSRVDTPISMNATESIEGETVSIVPPSIFGMHSKKIVTTGRMIVNPLVASFNVAVNAHIAPWSIDISEIQTLSEPGSYDPIGIGTGNFNYLLTNDTTVSRSIRVQGRIRLSTLQSVTIAMGATNYKYAGGFKIYIASSSGGPLIEIYDQPYQDSTTPITYDFDIDYTIDVAPGGHIYLEYIDYHEAELPDFDSGVIARSDDYQYFPESFLTFEEEGVFPASTSKGFLIYEVLNKVCECIVDRPDAIRSEFFGRTDTLHEYEEIGCGALMEFTNGLNIRRMRDKNNNLYPVITSFTDLYSSLDALYSLGIRVEIENDLEYIRIEPKEYFFDSEVVMQFPRVSNIESTVAIDKIYNEYENGYETWQVDGINGIDEYNTKRIFSIPVSNVKNRLTAVSKVIAGGYPIEATRRKQYDSEPTTDWQYDNDNFFICLNKTVQTFTDEDSNPYAIGGESYPKTYAIGTVAERDEAFTDIENLIDPASTYNLRISPIAMAGNWYPFLAGTIQHDPGRPIKFQSGTGNYQMKKKVADGCEPYVVQSSEDNDLNRDDLNMVKKVPFFRPVYHHFEYPLRLADYKLLRRNTNKSIEFSCTNSNFTKSYIEEMQYKPNSEDGGIVEIKCLEAFCTQGAFDEGFDDGFDIGSCD